MRETVLSKCEKKVMKKLLFEKSSKKLEKITTRKATSSHRKQVVRERVLKINDPRTGGRLEVSDQQINLKHWK